MYVYFTAFHFPGHPPTPIVPVYYTAITNKYPTPPTIQCTIQLLPVYYTAFTDKYPTPPINWCAEKSHPEIKSHGFFLRKKVNQKNNHVEKIDPEKSTRADFCTPRHNIFFEIPIVPHNFIRQHLPAPKIY